MSEEWSLQNSGDFSAAYIGEAGRRLSIRINEHHLDAFNKNRPHKSAFAAHLLISSHSVDNFNFSLLHNESSVDRSRISKMIEISRHSKLNDKVRRLVNELIPLNGLVNKVYS